ncbi:MAG: hypothetical protein ABI587_08550 [Gemmatimonadales bacterium]
MTLARAVTALTIPELGPSLGRLVAPLPVAGGPAGVPLDDLRIGLVSQLFDLAGDARRWAREGDTELALATLGRAAWDEAWQQVVQAAATRLGTRASERLVAAAREARLPARRMRDLPLDADEIRALAARLAAGAGSFHAALEALDRTAQPVRGGKPSVAAVLAWHDALAAVARRLEVAWLALEAAWLSEWQSAEAEVADLRRWRRSAWPLWTIAALLFGVALYAGLVVGGYIPVPPLLRGAVEALWSRWN